MTVEMVLHVFRTGALQRTNHYTRENKHMKAFQTLVMIVNWNILNLSYFYKNEWSKPKASCKQHSCWINKNVQFLKTSNVHAVVHINGIGLFLCKPTNERLSGSADLQ